MAHARLSPSGAHRWMACPGSVLLEVAFPDTTSSYALEGTAAHELASRVLDAPVPALAATYAGEIIEFNDHGKDVSWDVTPAMADHVDDYVALVREYAHGGTLMVEQRLPINHLTGEAGATGTSDAVVVHPDELTVIDLKFGMGLKVYAEDNPQLAMYALAALEEFGVLADFTTAVMVISQPRLNHVSEWAISVGQLLAFGDTVRAAATRVKEAATFEGSAEFSRYLAPGEKQCKFCKAKATCPALNSAVSEVVGSTATAADFANLVVTTVSSDTGGNYLAHAMQQVALVEEWCKAIRAETERRLFAGTAVDGYKLVEGKRGNRKWQDTSQVDALFKQFRLRQDEMYDFSLISPTTAEKLFKDNPKRWEKVQAHITQSEGKASVALATDRRPALVVKSVADDFRDLVQTEN